jgi:hypothetical protein
VRLDHVASFIVNANHGIMCVRNCVSLAVPQATKRKRIANEIDAAFIFARAHFVSVRGIIAAASGLAGISCIPSGFQGVSEG